MADDSSSPERISEAELAIMEALWDNSPLAVSAGVGDWTGCLGGDLLESAAPCWTGDICGAANCTRLGGQHGKFLRLVRRGSLAQTATAHALTRSGIDCW